MRLGGIFASPGALIDCKKKWNEKHPSGRALSRIGVKFQIIQEVPVILLYKFKKEESNTREIVHLIIHYRFLILTMPNWIKGNSKNISYQFRTFSW